MSENNAPKSSRLKSFKKGEGKKRESYRPTDSGSAERAKGLKLYYKVVSIYIAVVAILYGAMYFAKDKGYMLINTSLQYWLWYALVIGVVLLIGRFVSSLPKNTITRKSVKVCVVIVSICTILIMYVLCVNRIDSDFHKYSTITSEDGQRKCVVMKAELKTSADEEGAVNTYTLYRAYKQRNSFFCEYSKDAETIMFFNNPEALLKYEWGDKSLKVYTPDEAFENMNSITVNFE